MESNLLHTDVRVAHLAEEQGQKEKERGGGGGGKSTAWYFDSTHGFFLSFLFFSFFRFPLAAN